jgi:hypothetical protein
MNNLNLEDKMDFNRFERYFEFLENDNIPDKNKILYLEKILIELQTELYFKEKDIEREQYLRRYYEEQYDNLKDLYYRK